MVLSGSLTVNGLPASSTNHKQAFVQQEDVFYSQLTVMEVRCVCVGGGGGGGVEWGRKVQGK